MKKKILITVPTLVAGGMERAALNFAISFHQLGYEVKMFLVSSNTIYFDVPKEIEVISGKDNAANPWLTPLSLFKLRRFSKAYKPAIVLSFSGKMSAYVILALKGLNIPTLPFHRSNPNITYGKINNILNLLLFPKCKALVVQTSEAKRIFEKKYKNKNIIVVPNPIRELLLDKNVKKENIIINTSRLVKGKGIDDLIRIFAKTDTTDWSLHLLGDGDERSYLETLVRDLNIEDSVKFLGFQRNVDKYLSSASIFAFTSKSEGFPNSLLEAMCAGLACISFNCPTGPSDMIINGANGYLIDVDNHKEFEEKLNKLMSNKDLRSQFSFEAQKLNVIHNPERILNEFTTALFNL